MVSRAVEFARRYFVLALVVVLTTGAGLTYALVRTPVYTAKAYVIAIAESGDQAQPALSFSAAYGRIATQPETLAWAPPGLSPRTRSRLESHLRASTSPDAPMIQLTGSGAGSTEAASYANAGARALVSYGNAHRRETGVRLALLSPALPPATPTSPDLMIDMAVGAATGVLLCGLWWAAGGRRPRPAPRGRHDARPRGEFTAFQPVEREGAHA